MSADELFGFAALLRGHLNGFDFDGFDFGSAPMNIYVRLSGASPEHSGKAFEDTLGQESFRLTCERIAGSIFGGEISAPDHDVSLWLCDESSDITAEHTYRPMHSPIRLIEYWQNLDVTTVREIQDAKRTLRQAYASLPDMVHHLNDGGLAAPHLVVPEYLSRTRDVLWHVRPVSADEDLRDLISESEEHALPAAESLDVRIAYLDPFLPVGGHSIPDEFADPDANPFEVAWVRDYAPRSRPEQ